MYGEPSELSRLFWRPRKRSREDGAPEMAGDAGVTPEKRGTPTKKLEACI